MPTKQASEAAELAMPGWKAVTSTPAQVDAVKKAAPKRVDSRQLEVDQLRAKYFGTGSRTAVADAARQTADGEIVTVESSSSTSGGPKKLRVLVSNGRVTGVQG